MRRLIVYALLVSAALAGCLEDDRPAPRSATSAGSQASNGTNAAAEGATSEATRPSLAEGTVFVYATEGPTSANGSVRLVVADLDEGGYLLAGGNGTDLAGEIHHDRPWIGPVDERLNPRDEAGGSLRLFDWPLRDGKTWTLDAEAGIEVTANRSTVPGPGGEVPGFAVHGGSGSVNVSYTYAPSVGYLTSYAVREADQVLHEATLVEVDGGGEPVWYEAGTSHRACSDWPTDSARRFEVAADRDAIVAASVSTGPGTVTLVPPPAAGDPPHVRALEDPYRWRYDLVPAREGAWTMSAHSRTPTQVSGALVCVSAVAVSWTAPGG